MSMRLCFFFALQSDSFVNGLQNVTESIQQHSLNKLKSITVDSRQYSPKTRLSEWACTLTYKSTSTKQENHAHCTI